MPLFFQSANAPGVAHSAAGPPRARMSCQTITRRLESLYGSGRMRRAFTTLKIAVFAPIPSASVAIATSAKPGERTSILNPYRKSEIKIDMCALQERATCVPLVDRTANTRAVRGLYGIGGTSGRAESVQMRTTRVPVVDKPEAETGR